MLDIELLADNAGNGRIVEEANTKKARRRKELDVSSVTPDIEKRMRKFISVAEKFSGIGIPPARSMRDLGASPVRLEVSKQIGKSLSVAERFSGIGISLAGSRFELGVSAATLDIEKRMRKFISVAEKFSGIGIPPARSMRELGASPVRLEVSKQIGKSLSVAERFSGIGISLAGSRFELGVSAATLDIEKRMRKFISVAEKFSRLTKVTDFANAKITNLGRTGLHSQTMHDLGSRVALASGRTEMAMLIDFSGVRGTEFGLNPRLAASILRYYPPHYPQIDLGRPKRKKLVPFDILGKRQIDIFSPFVHEIIGMPKSIDASYIFDNLSSNRDSEDRTGSIKNHMHANIELGIYEDILQEIAKGIRAIIWQNEKMGKKVKEGTYIAYISILITFIYTLMELPLFCRCDNTVALPPALQQDFDKPPYQEAPSPQNPNDTIRRDAMETEPLSDLVEV